MAAGRGSGFCRRGLARGARRAQHPRRASRFRYSLPGRAAGEWFRVFRKTRRLRHTATGPHSGFLHHQPNESRNQADRERPGQTRQGNARARPHVPEPAADHVRRAGKPRFESRAAHRRSAAEIANSSAALNSGHTAERLALVLLSRASHQNPESETVPNMRQTLLPIQDVARKLEIPAQYFEQLGPFTAKLRLELLVDPSFQRRGKLILVTATTPTASGEGKTVTAIGLTQGLALIGKKVVITSSEPSLGPVFGMKGGAAGGGLSRIEPSEKINLHFNGDFHAISSAHNLLAALIDAHLFHGNDLDLDPERIAWPRAMDMNDRALRRIAVSLDSKKPGGGRRTGFVITAASEIMAIVALAHDRKDLRRRLEAIVIGVTRAGTPGHARGLGGTGGMMALT